MHRNTIRNIIPSRGISWIYIIILQTII
jgi:hypothetical protein